MRWLMGRKQAVSGVLARLLVWLPQQTNVGKYRQQREDLLQLDEKLGKALAYSGKGD